MKVVASERAARFIRDRGGNLWVWLDPHRGLVGAYVDLEAHVEPPGASRRTRFTRSSRRPHRFRTFPAQGFEVHLDSGRLDPPDELHLELRGWINKRIQAFWNGVIFVEDVARDLD